MISTKKRFDETWIVSCGSSLTGDDETSLGGRQSCFSGESMLGAALVGLVSVLGPDIANVKLTGRQHQVFPICSCVIESTRDRKVHRLFRAALIRPRVDNFLTRDN